MRIVLLSSRGCLCWGFIAVPASRRVQWGGTVSRLWVYRAAWAAVHDSQAYITRNRWLSCCRRHRRHAKATSTCCSLVLFGVIRITGVFVPVYYNYIHFRTDASGACYKNIIRVVFEIREWNSFWRSVHSRSHSFLFCAGSNHETATEIQILYVSIVNIY